MRFGSVCSGIEAASVAWDALGFTPVFHSEIDPAPSKVLAHHFPDVPNLGDFTTIGSEHELDILIGGTPCFPGGVLIVTKRGLVEIRDVVVGDEVLTHKAQWRKVLRTGSKQAETLKLFGQGQSSGVETTAEHPFWSREKTRVWVGRPNGSYASVVSEPSWVNAEDMAGKFWAIPEEWPETVAPPILGDGREKEGFQVTPDLMWVVGRWLGDGWTRINNRRGCVIICCGKAEKEEVRQGLQIAGVPFSVSEERTAFRFCIARRSFARWLKDNFGEGARGKTLPTWVFGLPAEFRQRLLDGYISADGCAVNNGFRLTTVSDRLALGTLLLATGLGKSASRRFCKPRRDVTCIEGREVAERGFWQIYIYDNARSSFSDGVHRFGKVKRTEQGSSKQVFNLEVDGDNSYVADGIVVHNCQSFSVSGNRLGLDDDRGNLALQFCRLAGRLLPRWVIWENVAGVLSTDGGRAFGSIVGALADLGYGWAYRVLDAGFFGSPHRRRRVFLVGHLGDWRGAGAVLFDGQGCFRNPPKSGASRYSACYSPEERARIFVEGKEGLPYLTASNAAKGINNQTPIILKDGVLRRFTPLEVERLFGFPDNWTAPIGADSPRYKALGNSMDVNVIRWLGKRIQDVTNCKAD